MFQECKEETMEQSVGTETINSLKIIIWFRNHQIFFTSKNFLLYNNNGLLLPWPEYVPANLHTQEVQGYIPKWWYYTLTVGIN